MIVALLLVLISRYLHRDSAVKSTKFGFYIERARYDGTQDVTWVPPDEQVTQEHWPEKKD